MYPLSVISFVSIDGDIAEQDRPGDPLRRSGMRGVPLHEAKANVLAHGRVLREFCERCWRAVADQLLTTSGIEPAEQADEFAVRTCNDRVLKHR